MTDPFVHLHVHSHYSMLDGHGTVKDIVAEAAHLGQPAVAITDHGNMSGVYELQKEAAEVGIAPIFGIEAYCAPVGADRFGRSPVLYGRGVGTARLEGSEDVSGAGAYTHLTLLGGSEEGLHNLFRLTSLSYIEGFYRKPRIDIEILSQYSKGIIGTTGCPSGEIQTRLRLGQYDKAREFAAQMQDILGRENYFMELMDHGMSIDLERKVIVDLLRLSKELSIPLLATNDSHYAREKDHIHHEHLLAMQTGAVMSEHTQDSGGRRFAFNGSSYFLKSAAQMAVAFGDEERFPGALSNTLLVAEMCAGVHMHFDEGLRPTISLPEGYTEESYLREQVYNGAIQRYGIVTEEIKQRLETEFSAILPKKYAGYFLVVADFVKWAKNNGVMVGPGRGSVGASVVAYCMDITELDPMRYPNLLFERFLNSERDSPPDIDMDFDPVGRERVIEYVTNKYGASNVSMIATFTKIGVKTGVKDSSKILERNYSDSDALTKMVPKAVAGHEITFGQIYDENSERYGEAADFRNLVTTLNAQDIIECAKGVEGRVKTTGVHAAGVIVSKRPLMDTVPLMMRQKDKAVITQFDYPTCESLGLIKIDFLGLRNLAIIDDAVKNIKTNRGEDVNVNDIIHGDINDEKTFQLLQSGNTLGVFQLDGGAMRELLRRMKPTEFDDIAAVLALYRPGPMGMNSHNEYADRKNKRTEINFLHHEFNEPLKDILGSTYGLCVYQEQVMQIAQRVAGYSLAQADNLRRAMGKKKKAVLDAEFIPFSGGMKERGYSQESITVLWETLVPFAGYGFNLAHAAGYALISYITAYLKANYPAEYMSALLTSVFDDKDTTAIYLQECRRMGITVLPPDVNLSYSAAVPLDNKTIVFGMAGVRGVSDVTSQMIVEARGKKKFVTLSDFLSRVPREASNKKVLEGLIDAGGFDSFKYTRRALTLVLPDAAKNANQIKKVEDSGQDSLFSIFGDDNPIINLELLVPDIDEFPKREKLSRERDALGLYVSDHPLSGIERALDAKKSNSIAEIKSGMIASVEGFPGRDHPRIKIAGVMSSVTHKRTRSGDPFAIVVIEDMTGSIEAPFFSRTFTKYQNELKTDHVYVLTGVPRVREAGETPTFSVDAMEEIETTADGKVPVWIRLTGSQCTPASLGELRSVLERHNGNCPVLISVRDGVQITDMNLPDELMVSPNQLFISEISALFGVDSIGRWAKPESE